MELTLNQIEKEFIEKEKKYLQLREELLKAQEKFNHEYHELSKKPNNLIHNYIQKTKKELTKKLNASRIPSDDNLIEIFVDNGNGKVSLHNHKTVQKPTEGLNITIHTERGQDLPYYESSFLPLRLTPKQAANWIIKHIKNFEYKNQYNINWFK